MEAVNLEQKKIMDEFVQAINSAIAILDRYEANRPSSLAFTKLEEAILWGQVCVGVGKLKIAHSEPANDPQAAS